MSHSKQFEMLFKYALRILLLAAMMLVFYFSGWSQITLTTGAGYYAGGKVNVIAGIGYDYRTDKAATTLAGKITRRAILSADVRTNVFSNGAYFGTYAGYVIPIGNMALIPYAGYWYHLVGDRRSQDRYVHDGITTIISTGSPVNGSVPGAGLRLQIKIIYIEAAYVGQFTTNFGTKFRF